MKSLLRLDKPGLKYESNVRLECASMPGVSYTIQRMSFARRSDLIGRIRDIASPLKYLEASTDFHEQVAANLLAQQVEELYLRWGLVRIHGLTIDGLPADVESLIASGPEALTKEIVAAIKLQCGLTEEERKN